MNISVCLIIALSFVICVKSQFVPRYEIIPEHFEFPLGANDKLFNYGTIRPKKFNHTTYVVDGELELLQPFNDDLLWHFSIYALQGNEYRQYSTRNGDGLCTATYRYRPLAEDWFQYTTLPYDYICPIQPGKYRFNNMAIQNQMLIAQPPNSNKYRLNYTFFDGDELISACAIYITLNKQSLI